METTSDITPEKFAFLRKNRGITQVKLANYISKYFRKCSSRTISRWETGCSKLPQFALIALNSFPRHWNTLSNEKQL